MLFARGIISTIFSVIITNKELKKVVWDGVPLEQFKNLAIRSSQATCLILIQFTIVKYLSLVYIGLAQNCTPLVTVIMSYLMTGEEIVCVDILLILITFVGVTLVTIGFKK